MQSGALAVPDGRAIAPTLNALLALPFAHRIATRDHHPPDHLSFASPAAATPETQAFTGAIDAPNPLDPTHIQSVRLWPPHCVQGTPGAELIPELDASRFDVVVSKGQAPGVEMLSGFADVWGNGGGARGAASVDLGAWLEARGVTDVFVAGLAGDFCVGRTAVDAAGRGLRTWVVRDAQRCIDEGAGWGKCLEEFAGSGVKVVDSGEVRRILGGG